MTRLFLSWWWGEFKSTIVIPMPYLIGYVLGALVYGNASWVVESLAFGVFGVIAVHVIITFLFCFVVFNYRRFRNRGFVNYKCTTFGGKTLYLSVPIEWADLEAGELIRRIDNQVKGQK